MSDIHAGRVYLRAADSQPASYSRDPGDTAHSPDRDMEETFGLSLFLAGALVCLLAVVGLLVAAPWTTLVLLAGVGLALAGKRILEVVDE